MGERVPIDALIAEATEFLGRLESADASQRSADADRGFALARRLRSGAIDLSVYKATEYSPAIPRLHLLAAEVALAALGPDSPKLAPFEQDVFYYETESFTPPHAIVAEYRQFKDRLRG